MGPLVNVHDDTGSVTGRAGVGSTGGTGNLRAGLRLCTGTMTRPVLHMSEFRSGKPEMYYSPVFCQNTGE